MSIEGLDGMFFSQPSTVTVYIFYIIVSLHPATKGQFI